MNNFISETRKRKNEQLRLEKKKINKEENKLINKYFRENVKAIMTYISLSGIKLNVEFAQNTLMISKDVYYSFKYSNTYIFRRVFNLRKQNNKIYIELNFSLKEETNNMLSKYSLYKMKKSNFHNQYQYYSVVYNQPKSEQVHEIVINNFIEFVHDGDFQYFLMMIIDDIVDEYEYYNVNI